jgi:hypothetical protein
VLEEQKEKDVYHASPDFHLNVEFNKIDTQLRQSQSASRTWYYVQWFWWDGDRNLISNKQVNRIDQPPEP